MRFIISSIFKPNFFELFKKGKYNKETFLSDVVSGVIVGIVALPLAIAFGIASGVTPHQGLITAVIAGFLISFFGGTNYLIGGPTGAFIVIVAGIVAQYGMQGLIISTVMAGIILIIMGVFKLGTLIKFIPYPIIVGFTSGISVVIFSTQIKDFLGMSIDNVPSEFVGKWGSYLSNLSSISITETLMSICCLMIIIFWPKINKKIPGSLIAIIFGTIVSLLLSRFAGINFATIGSKFPELAGGISIPQPVAPKINFVIAKNLVQPAFTIAILCAIESLLAAMVADGVTGKRHNSNTELIGEGIANIIVPLFGGIPATGAIARTMTNINNGGKTPVAGIIHSIVLLLIFLFLMPYAVYIPLSCLAAILVMVAYNMSEWRTFKYLLKADFADVIVLLITFFLTVLIDLTVAIEVGLVMAIILFVKRVSETSKITVLEQDFIAGTENDEKAQLADTEHLDIPIGVEIFEIDGPFFFGQAIKLDELDREQKNKPSVRILRMRKVPFIDSTGLNNLRNLCKRSKKENIKVILSGVNDNVYASLEKIGLLDELGRDFVHSHIISAMAKATDIIENQKLNK
ncbi:MAG: SulP family inorganic anion transporter [Acidaminococcaceae bacterium]|nr:SulP family inorganic anion transporter [Acidaminococcaceae bacterium]